MVWKITTDDLLAQYNTGKRNFAGIELIPYGDDSAIDLDGVVLRDINLRGSQKSHDTASPAYHVVLFVLGGKFFLLVLWMMVVKSGYVVGGTSVSYQNNFAA
ncbi:MAG: hypothetical protein H0X31_06525 [Nostocaceae cyanobacterium]|nr:hypothetical protein [Nostocaceae cyanobacterium]